MAMLDIASALQVLKNTSNGIYDDFKVKFLYHTNKIEGSTFSLPEIITLLKENFVSGDHSWDDIVETRNSLHLFDYIVEDCQSPLTAFKLREYHQLLKQYTTDAEHGFAGVFKKIPNVIIGPAGQHIKVAQPHEVPEKMDYLLGKYNERQMILQEMTAFHLELETIHPFQDGNGRIGRFLLLKQCLACNQDPIYIHSESAQAYRNALQLSRVEKNIEPLAELFQSAQKNFNAEFPLLYDIRKNYEQEVRDIMAVEKADQQESTPERGK
ncbi:Fic family protein [Negativicoccus succinicivorans]|uniref:Fic family protein n=1 Tax=Negativicoccus succinicivorans TaxID=620903 RepID=UPI0029001543|nr:Fic family protein [Negativicoccus succinicivorans]MDU2418081.1 Fic family protein [Negativicoccus succinicivorans]